MPHIITQSDINKAFISTGHIFMMLLWVQKIMIDLIITSKHGRIIHYINSTGKSPTLLRERKKYGKKDFKDIIKLFFEEFPVENGWPERLELLLMLRNAIGHCMPSVGRTAVYIQPRGNLKDLLIKFLGVNKRGISKSSTFKIDFSNQGIYESFYKQIIETEELFRHISKNQGLNYLRIR